MQLKPPGVATSGSTRAGGNVKDGRERDKSVCSGRARDGINAARWTECLWAARSLFVLFPKGEPYNYDKATILYSRLPWKSLYFTGQGHKRTHTLLATTHWNRSEQGLAGEETEKGSDTQQWWGGSESVHICVTEGWSCRRCAEPGKKSYFDRESVSDFESGQCTHPANHIPRNRQEGRMRGEDWAVREEVQWGWAFMSAEACMPADVYQTVTDKELYIWAETYILLK